MAHTQRTPAGAARWLTTTRTEAYTDAVFAIAATILVLDLSVDAIGEVGTNAQMWDGLVAMWPSILSFVISFGLLSLRWTIHLQQFRDIVRVDGPLLWLNNVQLLFVVLMPFATSLTDGYSDFLAGRVVLPLVYFLASLFGHLSWRWAASRGGHLLREDARARVREDGMDGLAAVLCAAVAAVASPWIGSWGFAVFALNPLLTRVLQRQPGRSRGEAPEGAGPGADESGDRRG